MEIPETATAQNLRLLPIRPGQKMENQRSADKDGDEGLDGREALVYERTYKKLVMPPRTADGIATRDAANLAKTPMMIRNMLPGHQSCRIVGPSQGGEGSPATVSSCSISASRQCNHTVVLRKGCTQVNTLGCRQNQRRANLLDMGVMVMRAAMTPFRPSASTPPWIRDS